MYSVFSISMRVFTSQAATIPSSKASFSRGVCITMPSVLAEATSIPRASNSSISINSINCPVSVTRIISSGENILLKIEPNLPKVPFRKIFSTATIKADEPLMSFLSTSGSHILSITLVSPCFNAMRSFLKPVNSSRKYGPNFLGIICCVIINDG